jgi:hypothetical protein
MRRAIERRSVARAAFAALAAAVAGCGGQVDVGSDVLWTARFETGSFSEWTGAPGGAVTPAPAPAPASAAEISSDRVHRGRFAGKLTVDAGAGAGQQSAALSRKGSLPMSAYYSAWYYLPRTTTVDGFWVVFKIRRRDVADDPSTESELFDLDLVSMPTGEMGLQLYDHRIQAVVPLQAADVVVPVGVWFQLEAFYRNAADDSGRFAVWLDGAPVVDVGGSPTSQAAWVEWSVVSIGESLDPAAAVVYVDDCAVSRTRVGPTGIIDP